MECSIVHFSEDVVESKFRGAGIVPVSYHAGTYYFLLGRERWVYSWSGSCRWSGFEGSRKSGESPVQTAVRECREETLNVFGSDAFRLALVAKAYWMRVVVNVTQEKRNLERFNVCYAVPIRWNDSIPDKFETMRQTVEHVDRLAQEFEYKRQSMLGSNTPCGLDLSRFHVGPIAHDPDGQSVTVQCLLLEEEFSLARCAAVVQEERPDASGEWHATAENPRLYVGHFQCAKIVRHVCEWSEVRARLTRALIDHPCLQVTRDAQWQLVQRVHVQHEFLEKDHLRWWSEQELRQVMQNRGTYEHEKFRPYFLPVLQTLLGALPGAQAL